MRSRSLRNSFRRPENAEVSSRPAISNLAPQTISDTCAWRGAAAVVHTRKQVRLRQRQRAGRGRSSSARLRVRALRRFVCVKWRHLPGGGFLSCGVPKLRSHSWIKLVCRQNRGFYTQHAPSRHALPRWPRAPAPSTSRRRGPPRRPCARSGGAGRPPRARAHARSRRRV
jgi:hypothetical protein